MIPPDYMMACDDVHVWTARLSTSAVNIDHYLSQLQEEERSWAYRFELPEDRVRHAIGRYLVHIIAGKLLGKEPRELRFETEAFGRPKLSGELNALDLRFSISHSGDFVLAAFTLGRHIGIDVEAYSNIDFAEVAGRFFSAYEQSELSDIQVADRRESFFRCWCRKEAYVKATGLGFSCATENFDVSLKPGDPPKLIATRPDPKEAKRWELHDLDVGRGYAAALAVEGHSLHLKRWTLFNA